MTPYSKLREPDDSFDEFFNSFSRGSSKPLPFTVPSLVLADIVAAFLFNNALPSVCLLHSRTPLCTCHVIAHRWRFASYVMYQPRVFSTGPENRTIRRTHDRSTTSELQAPALVNRSKLHLFAITTVGSLFNHPCHLYPRHSQTHRSRTHHPQACKPHPHHPYPRNPQTRHPQPILRSRNQR